VQRADDGDWSWSGGGGMGGGHGRFLSYTESHPHVVKPNVTHEAVGLWQSFPIRGYVADSILGVLCKARRNTLTGGQISLSLLP
jgi:hypothetical protein